jgi:hypothetical protein
MHYQFMGACYFVQEQDDAPDADDDPLGQGVHFADPAALYVPAEHGKQLVPTEE